VVCPHKTHWEPAQGEIRDEGAADGDDFKISEESVALQQGSNGPGAVRF